MPLANGLLLQDYGVFDDHGDALHHRATSSRSKWRSGLEPVVAYIDPGSGSLIIQVLIASIVAAPILLRQQVGRIVRRLRGAPEEVRVTMTDHGGNG